MALVSACSAFTGFGMRIGVSLPSDACTSMTSSSSTIAILFPYRSWMGRMSGIRGSCWSGTRGMDKLVENQELKSGVRLLKGMALKDWNEPLRSFLKARNEEEILSCIRKEVEAGKLPSNVAMGMEELYYNYRNAVLRSRNPLADEIILSNMAVALDRIFLDVEDPFVFPPHHKAVREPFDYYFFGQNYFHPLVDFRNSYVGNISIFHEVEEKLQLGHNVILISNHQTEADPALIGLLIESTNPRIAEEMTYVAGDRVVTDTLCKPFSMGRNLLCVYSKKHLYDFPDLVEMKRRANTRSLKAMALLLREGGNIIWIAPSGGRDRPDSATGEWYPAQFDDSSVDNMRRLVDHSSVPGHMYPLALLCHDIMPPPRQVAKEIGERRSISFHGIGMSIGPEIKFEDIAASVASTEAKVAFSQALYNSVNEQYNVLKSAIYEHEGLNASNSSVSLSQPWNDRLTTRR